MYTLALDETSGFEKFTIQSGNDQVTFIGGFIFDDKGDSAERDKEAKRIEAYYRKVIDTVNQNTGEQAEFPQDLHRNNNNAKIIGAVKQEIEKTLPVFLKYGTYDNQPLTSAGRRNGTYRIVCYVKSAKGKTTQSGDILVRDDYASNLYLNMLRDALKRFVYENILIEKGAHFNLQIATRATGSYDIGSNESKEYESLGYYQKNSGNQNSKIWSHITSTDVIRTMIQDLQSKDANISVDSFSAKSIIYDEKNVNECIFLYLADSICSILAYKMNTDPYGDVVERQDDKKNNHNPPNLNQKITMVCKKFHDYFQPEEQDDYSDSQFWMLLYDDIDEQYGNLLALFNKGNFYESLEFIHSIRQQKTEFSTWYDEKWVCHIENRILEELSEGTFADSVNKLYVSQKSNTYNNMKGLYIFQFLEKASEKNEILKNNRETMKKLYVAGVIAHCHFADSNMAEQYIKCLDSFRDILGDDESRLDNMLCDSYLDGFMWLNALQLVSDMESRNENRLKIKTNNYTEKMEVGYLDDAKFKSQAGQVYAFARNSKSEEYFKSAMEVLSKQNEKTADYYITMSYLMHYYIDNDNRENYDALATEYFGNNENLQNQLQYLLEERNKEQPIIHFNYAIYLYLKGLYIFHHDEINEDMWEQIKALHEMIHTIGHPMELIAKYIAWMAIEKKETDTLKKYKAKLRYDKNRKYTTVEAIRHMSMIQVLEKEAALADSNVKIEKEKEAEQEIQNMAKLLTENISGFYTIDENNVKKPKLDLDMEPKQLYDILKKYFVYMYN